MGSSSEPAVFKNQRWVFPKIVAERYAGSLGMNLRSLKVMEQELTGYLPSTDTAEETQSLVISDFKLPHEGEVALNSDGWSKRAMSGVENLEIKCRYLNITLPAALIRLSVRSCRDLQRVTGDLTMLSLLITENCPVLEELPSLYRVSCLKQIFIESCEKLQGVSGIEELNALQWMRLCYCSNAVIQDRIHKLKVTISILRLNGQS
ncbi:hypothetical protein SUGI_0677770 [Cryptomeria japonica]|nr:hypothetical protein SUGI_0677770 [Cryptomeria japonica]